MPKTTSLVLFTCLAYKYKAIFLCQLSMFIFGFCKLFLNGKLKSMKKYIHNEMDKHSENGKHIFPQSKMSKT